MPAHRPVHHREKRVHGNEKKTHDTLPDGYEWVAVRVDEQERGEWQYTLMRIVAVCIFFGLLLQPVYAMLRSMFDRPSVDGSVGAVARLLPGPIANYSLEAVLILVGIVFFILFMQSRFVAMMFFMATLLATPVIGIAQFVQYGVFTSPHLETPTIVSFGLIILALLARSLRTRIASVASVFVAIVALWASLTVGSGVQAERGKLITNTAAVITGIERDAADDRALMNTPADPVVADPSESPACWGDSIYPYPCTEQAPDGLVEHSVQAMGEHM